MTVQKMFLAKTGTGVSLPASIPSRNVLAFCNLTYGATPTITLALEGSYDGTNWARIVCQDDSDTTQASALTFTYTTGSPKAFRPTGRPFYPYYRVNITANTNVTVDAWIGGDETDVAVA